MFHRRRNAGLARQADRIFHLVLWFAMRLQISPALRQRYTTRTRLEQ